MFVHPLVFEPIYKPKIWGGDRIFTHFDRAKVSTEPIGESWELADLEEDRSRVAQGPARGISLPELVADWGDKLMGRVGLIDGRFPLLIKFLDARQSLSVQVHPNERVARKRGGNVRVKHESWYILAADAGAAIYHGFEPGVDAATFREAMVTGRIEGVLRRIEVRPGHCYHLPSGTPHALGEGVLVAEVQTPSDITYRTYDWGRVDPQTGQPRDLHLDQAMECIDFDSPSPPAMQKRSHLASMWTAVTRLVSCPSFAMDQVRMFEGTQQRILYDEPVVWIVLEGQGSIDWRRGSEPIPIRAGNVVLLPADLPDDASVKIAKAAQWLEVIVPVEGESEARREK